MARGDTEFCRVEVDFIANDPRCHRLNDHQFRVYICLWAMAVHERRTGFRMDDALWPSRVRTLAAWAQTTPQNIVRTLSAIAQDPSRTLSGGLLDLSKGVLRVLSVERKHSKLKGWRDPYGVHVDASCGSESKSKSKSKSSPHTPRPPQDPSAAPAAVPGKARKAKPESPPLNGVTGGTVVAAWIDAYRANRGTSPKPTGKDTAAAKRLAPLFDNPEDVAGVMDLFLRDDCAFLRGVGWALWALEARLNGYRTGEGWKEEGDDRPGYDQPWEGRGGEFEDPGERRRGGESDFEALGGL